MAIPVVTFNPAAGPVTMSVEIGQLQVGSYTVTELDENAKHLREVAKGNNFDNKPDVFSLPSEGHALDKHYIHWQALIDAADDAPDPKYDITVSFAQSGNNLIAPIVRRGKLEGTRVQIGAVRFAAT